MQNYLIVETDKWFQNPSCSNISTWKYAFAMVTETPGDPSSSKTRWGVVTEEAQLFQPPVHLLLLYDFFKW